MYKLLSIFLASIIFPFSVFCKEPNLILLVNILSNETQEFKIGNYSYECTPYGVVTLERLYSNATPDSVCRKSIDTFYKKRKELQFFLHYKLHRQQLYSVVYKDEKCIINIEGEKSLSEVLLEEGLAMKLPTPLSREHDFYFYKAEKKARLQKKGLWATNIAKDCIASIYNKN